ncbi:hypothetical protein [Streptomyces sp. NRRL B-24484]|uniref:hypothetical protein n=1 Tax=Streptomyces sp. NRRL B-24484 TaxID=1463833 RepID=UPI0004C0D51A|nr:hypothetical protein [Streptomyces sp. NRRL B-24484]
MEHQIFEIVDTVEEGPFYFVVDLNKVTRSCWCKLADEDERPATPCPLDEERRAEQLGRLSGAFRSVLERGQEQPEPVRAQLLGWSVGDYVSWDLRDGAATVRITGISTQYGRFFTYESWDGHREGVDDSVFMSLEEKVANWRRATDEERERFDRLYRPAPQNWD